MEANKREYATGGKLGGTTFPSRQAVAKGKAFPNKPRTQDGKYEGGPAGQTRLASFK
jgi:hypothetical protein